MSYTNTWDDSVPTGAEAANTIDNIFRSLKVDIEQRFVDIFAMPNFTDDPLRPYGLKFADAQDAVVSLGDNAGTPRAVLIKSKAGSSTYYSLAYNSLLLTLGTVTTDVNGLSLTQTWNNGAVAFTGVKINFTSTASAATSLIVDLQVGGTSQWKVTKAGATTQLGALTVSGGGIIVTGNSSITGTLGVSSTLTITTGGITVSAGGVTVTGNSTITGTLDGLTGLTVASGGISITGASTFSSTINSQTISATANFTGTLTVATGLTVSAGGANITGNSTITGTLVTSDTVTINKANANAYFAVNQSGSEGEVGFRLNRSGGTTADWILYAAPGSSSLRFYSAGLRAELTAAGALSLAAGISATSVTGSSAQISTDGTLANYRWEWNLSGNNMQLASRSFGNVLTWNYTTGVAAFAAGISATTVTSTTNGFFAENGSNGSPTFRFTADDDVGIYRHAANTLGVSGAGGLVVNAGISATTGTFSGKSVTVNATLESWDASITVHRFGARGAVYADSANTFMTANVYGSSSDKYIATAVASMYLQTAGVHTFRAAASGSADATITWTDVLSVSRSAGGKSIMVADLPTSAAGLATGTLWNNSGVVNVA